MRTFLLAALLAACTTLSVAQLPTNGPSGVELAHDAEVSRIVGDAPTGEYVLDPRHTSVLWRVRHWGLSPYTGRFDTVSGRLYFDASEPDQSSVRVRIPLSSISTGLLSRAGERAFDRDIAAYLGGETHPEIEFVSNSIQITSPTSGLIHGELSFSGQTHSATLETVFEGGRIIPTSGHHAIAFTARTIIRRSHWLANVPPLHNSNAPGEEVEIIVSAEFLRAP
jgi:polyisoprenoid-binding protein YceI